MEQGPLNAITDVPGIKVGQIEDREALTGVTVILAEDGATGAVDVRGANPGTFHTDALHPMNLSEDVRAIVLTGGSLFGLASATGVMQYLDEQGIGVDTGAVKIPVVSGAVIFDLTVGRADVYPTAEMGYRAAREACPGAIRQGNAGCGTGATAGKTPLSIPTKGGIGTASAVLPGGVTVGAITSVNALGDVINPCTRSLYALSGFGDLPSLHRLWAVQTNPGPPQNGLTDSTTIACIATNARLSKVQLAKVADMAHQGLARAIRPIHTMRDGDTVFAVAVHESPLPAGGSYPGEDTDIIGSMAADVLTQAVINAVMTATGIPGFPSYRDWRARWGLKGV